MSDIRMSSYSEYFVDRVEVESHTRGCSWHSSGSCNCKRPDVVIEDSRGFPIIGYSRQGYRVSLRNL